MVADVCICKKCGHNMGRSRCKPFGEGWHVRCNSCKTHFVLKIRFPSKKTPAKKCSNNAAVKRKVKT